MSGQVEMKWLNWVKTSYKFFLILMLSGCQETAMSNEVNIKNKASEEQHFLELKVSSAGINYYVLFNDVEVFDEVSESPINNTIPVNHWVKNGTNAILVGVNFKDQENAITLAKTAELTIDLILRIKTADTERSVTLTKFDLGISEQQLKRLKTGELEETLENKNLLVASNSWLSKELDTEKLFLNKTYGLIKTNNWSSLDEDTWTDFAQKLTLNLDYPEWAYLSGDDLGDVLAMTDDEFFALSDNLYAEYQKIWQLMKNKNKDELLPLFAQRASEFDAAYYLPKGEKYADMDYSLTSAFNHKDLFLKNMVETDYAELRIEAEGKLAILRVGGVAEPLIYYGHVRDSFTRSYTFYFMRKKGKWIIIR
jgi:hypothetical protein